MNKFSMLFLLIVCADVLSITKAAQEDKILTVNGKIICVEGNLFVERLDDESLSVRELDTGKSLARVNPGRGYEYGRAYLSRSGNHLIAQLYKRVDEGYSAYVVADSIQCIKIKTGKKESLLWRHGTLVAFDKNTNKVIGKNMDSPILHMWDAEDLKPHTIDAKFPDMAYGKCTLNSVGDKIAALLSQPGYMGGCYFGNAEQVYKCYNLRTGENRCIKVENACSDACFNPVDNLFVLNSHSAEIWDVERETFLKGSGVPEEQSSHHSCFNTLRTIAYALVYRNKGINIWDTRTAQLMHHVSLKLKEHFILNDALAISDSGETIAARCGMGNGDEVTKCCIIDAVRGQVLGCIDGVVHGFDAHENVYAEDASHTLRLYNKQSLAQ